MQSEVRRLSKQLFSPKGFRRKVLVKTYNVLKQNFCSSASTKFQQIFSSINSTLHSFALTNSVKLNIDCVAQCSSLAEQKKLKPQKLIIKMRKENKPEN